MAQDPPPIAFAELGICSRKPDWNIGYGARTLQLVLGNAFNSTTPHVVYLCVDASHFRARQPDEGTGFFHGGTMGRALFQDGRYVELNIMGILRPQLHNSREGQ